MSVEVLLETMLRSSGKLCSKSETRSQWCEAESNQDFLVLLRRRATNVTFYKSGEAENNNCAINLFRKKKKREEGKKE